ncbi:hypothetical protein GFS31_27660 [Leptolyngbya sp. BL0902]|uniref:hypothetical protein n=1 Tax=Leptolyngbya sp. BL0902 TaxID=1115757 RepID=UPI0018E85B8C|nr:hypothetical protein [Leptolyngbya sp. BL0902]QQE66070.1 hypothetical protein GFS31_27660 [Leptolyngbya sp. BL0902]
MDINQKIYQTDWLASSPVFYNELTGQVSHNINDVIDFSKFDFHPEGLNNYLEFGYSVFGQTPIKNIKFLRHSSKLTVGKNNEIKVEHLEDSSEYWLDKATSEDDVFQLLCNAIHQWEKSVQGEIVIPTSGGYDSRLLNFLIEDKSRVRAFTYGISNNQEDSFEAIYAKLLCKKLSIQWERIEIGNYHHYINDWDSIFGVSTHAHGMYQIEFYHKILSKVEGNNPFLSGIIGDAWAGSVNITEIQSPSDILKLGYSHGIKADSQMSYLSSKSELINEYYEIHKDKLNLPIFRVIESMRFKIILLSYLMRIPRHLGFQAWSPFLDIETALSMLTLPSERRKNRLWQKEFFEKNNLNLEDMGFKTNKSNTLNLQAMKISPLDPLNSNLLREIIHPDYVEWINRHIPARLTSWDVFWNIHRIPKVRRLVYVFNLEDKRLKAYYAYLTLKPLENLIKRRNAILYS